MNPPKLWNLRDPLCPPDVVRIDRRTQWANPFRMSVFGRDAAIEMYRWLWFRDSATAPFYVFHPNHKEKVALAVQEWSKSLKYGSRDLSLLRRQLDANPNVGCRCTPLPCHWNVLEGLLGYVKEGVTNGPAADS